MRGTAEFQEGWATLAEIASAARDGRSVTIICADEDHAKRMMEWLARAFATADAGLPPRRWKASLLALSLLLGGTPCAHAAPCGPTLTPDCTLASHPAVLHLDGGRLLIEVCYADFPADACTGIRCASTTPPGSPMPPGCQATHPTLRQWCQELQQLSKPPGGESFPVPFLGPGEACSAALAGQAAARLSGEP